MKKKDFLFVLSILICFSPFFLSDSVYQSYSQLNLNHGMVMSFVKFAILATLGEVIGLRISSGVYNRPGFGILPRAMVWGFLGLAIKIAFVIFATGTVKFLIYMGLPLTSEILKSEFSVMKLLTSFSISASMNMIFGVVLMTVHKITDEHIIRNNGKLFCLLKPIDFASILGSLNWNVMWNFVYKKTIPLFWIPAHTITFLLPEQFQVLFAALLGIALGVFLAIASVRSKAKIV